MTTNDRFPTGSERFPGNGASDRFPVPPPLRGGTGPEPHTRGRTGAQGGSSGSRLSVIGSYDSDDGVDVWVKGIEVVRGRPRVRTWRVQWSSFRGWSCSCGGIHCEHVARVRDTTRLGQALERTGGE